MRPCLQRQIETFASRLKRSMRQQRRAGEQLVIDYAGSVPHALARQTLEARMTVHGIELLLRGGRVAAHARSSRRLGFSTLDAHMFAAKVSVRYR